MSNEITVRLKCTVKEICDILEKKGFSIIDKYFLEDFYYIKEDINIKELTIREILKEYILIRNVTQFIPNEFIDSYKEVSLTFKRKNISSDGTIISQEKKDCQIKDKIQGEQFLNAIGYKELMIIREKAVEYEKDGLQITIKDVENNEKLIEVETVDENNELDTIEKLIQKINKLEIPIYTDDYFVKKAEIELEKILLGE